MPTLLLVLGPHPQLIPGSPGHVLWDEATPLKQPVSVSLASPRQGLGSELSPLAASSQVRTSSPGRGNPLSLSA